jgi:hypothetical protein
VILLPDAVSENTKARRIRSVGLFSSSRKSAWLFMKPAALSPFRPTVPPFKVRGRNKKELHQKKPALM